MRAILSVSDKSGIVDFARGLHGLGVEIHSTGGTKKALEEAGIPVRSVEDLTRFPEILDGRVKTLHPGVHAGILARRDLPDHLSQLAERGLVAIDLVAVNLYPFVQTVSREGTTLEEAIEMAEMILDNGPIAITQAKHVINRGLEMPIEKALHIESEGYEVCIPTQDRVEALVAFKEKRKPEFKGE